MAESAIHLKNRTIRSLAGESGRMGRHYMLQFRSFPDAEVRAELARRGIRVISFVPDSTLMVSSESAPDLRGLPVASAGSLSASDKISSLLVSSPHVEFLVMMFPDVAPEAATAVLEQQGFTIIPRTGLRSGDYVVVGPSAKLEDLAASDEVSYIMPAPRELSGSRMISCAGALTDAGVVAQYVEESPGWPDSSPTGEVALNYTLETLAPNLDVNAVRSEIQRALNQWASYTNLSFSEGSDPQAARTIDIKFATGPHGDDYPFDGSSMLAHTFYPAPPNAEPIAGDMHLNLDENWQIGSASGIDLFSVALHEAGHALGLGHTDNPDSVMYPYYRILAGLSVDDIAGIRALYGTSVSTPPASQQPMDPSMPVTTPVTSPATPPVNAPTTPAITPPFTTPATPAPTVPTPATPITPPFTTPATPAPSPATPAATPAAPATPAPSGNTTPPALQIISPATTILSTAASSVTVTGTASDNVGIASVVWKTSNGGYGTATGTTNWSAQVPLLTGDNVVIVTAYDTAGNSSWRAFTVVHW